MNLSRFMNYIANLIGKESVYKEIHIIHMEKWVVRRTKQNGATKTKTKKNDFLQLGEFDE